MLTPLLSRLLTDAEPRTPSWQPAIALALFLFIATALWVPVNPEMIHTSTDYYTASLENGFQPRALAGTVAHILNLTPGGFLYLLQLARFAWLALLCTQIFRCIADRYIAFLLCAMFAFNSPLYITDAVGGIVDMVTNFWLLAAAVLMLRYHRASGDPLLRLGVLLLPLYLALLTHEKSFFDSIVLLSWAVLFYGRAALIAVIPWALICGQFFWMIWDKHTGGLPPATYADFFLHQTRDILLHQSLNVIGICFAAGMLWVVYGVVGIGAMRRARDRSRRWKYATFLGIGILANLAPLSIAHDTQRIAGGLWLPLFILIVDQAEYIGRRAGARMGWTVLCILHLLIPPVFIYEQGAVPLNCYAAQALSAFGTEEHGSVWTLQYYHQRPDIGSWSSCWPTRFWQRIPAPAFTRLSTPPQPL